MSGWLRPRSDGFDVSVKETGICIVDESGEIVREAKVPTEPEAIATVLRTQVCDRKRIGL